MGIVDRLNAMSERAQANHEEALRKRDMHKPDMPEPRTLTKQYVSERQYRKDAEKLARKGWTPESINNQGKPGWSKVLGGPMVNERLQVTYTKDDQC